MTVLILHAGALIAPDGNDRAVWAMVRAAIDDETEGSFPAVRTLSGPNRSILIHHDVPIAVSIPFDRWSGGGDRSILGGMIAWSRFGCAPDWPDMRGG